MLERPTFLVFLFIIVALLDYYLFQSVKIATKNPKIAYVAVIVDIILTIVLLFLASDLRAKRDDRDAFQTISALFFVIFVPKLVLILPMLIEDITRLIRYVWGDRNPKGFYPDRRRAVSLIALGMASVAFFGVFYGIVKGKFNYKIKTIPLKLPKLPQSFKGFKIIQISDIHSGSFHSSAIKEIERGVDLINAQQPDLVLFTGDLVNLKADEIIPFKEVFGKIEAKLGKYSVLGNHDYGDYAYGNNEAKNEQNRKLIGKHLADMGFRQLRNQHVKVEKEGAFINIIGVENFGADLRFPKTGDLVKATEGMEEGTTNILMSHDPTHFDHQLTDYTNILDFPKPIHLTLAGHTHGMQLGIDIPGIIKFSPVQFIYKKWKGLYQEKGKYLYVNPGFGYLGFPGRVGIWPEITVFELEPEDN